jgi:GT2 family glycosyltransferase
VDATLLALWQYSEGRSLEEISIGFHNDLATPKIIQAALACLAEAGLLDRNFDPSENEKWVMPSTDRQLLPASPQVPISALIVNYNSFEWIKECIASLLAQTYTNIQIIVVDNGSYDGALEWLETNSPDIQRLQIKQSTSLSHAINAGVSLAPPDNYLLILNPDVRLENDAVVQMVSVALSDPLCAAVAPKLFFSWAPQFLNGLGNYVGPISWGTDNAIGHLDLGQFNSYHELPSACFAAALITPKAWKAIGPLDEGFPMYYEDVEWCYRARLLGFRILAAPSAVIFHAFGGSLGSTGHSEGMTPRKLSNVVYGRQRFALKLLHKFLVRFLRNYIIEDLLNFIRYFFSGNFGNAYAYLTGWSKVMKTLPSILSQRHLLQASRVVSDEDLFKIQRDIPMPLVWNGLPELTWDLIISHYYPLIAGKRTRSMPELSTQNRHHLLVVSTGVTTDTSSIVRQLIQNLVGKMDITVAVPSTLAKSAPEIPESVVPGNGYFQQVSYSPERPKSLHLLVDNSDIAIIPGKLVSSIPLLEYTESRLIILLPTYNTYPKDANDMDPMLSLGDFFISTISDRPDWLKALKAKTRSDIPVEYDLETITLYCLEGRFAPDRDPRVPYPVPPPPEPARHLALMVYIWRTQGFRSMLHRTRRYINQHLLHSSE